MITEEAHKILKEMTRTSTIVLVERGNHAIIQAMQVCIRHNPSRHGIIIPDQGGWLTYQHYPKKLKQKIIMLKTKYGLLDLKDLDLRSKDACACIYENPAGYFAHQDTEKIFSICRKNGCLVILDVSGCLGDKKLCRGDHADIIVGSFGKGKPVDLGYGGFIASKDPDISLKAVEASFDAEKIPHLIKKLKKLPGRLKHLYLACSDIKEDLKGMKIIHPSKKGIVVVVKHESQAEKEKIISYCQEKDLEYTLCPRYIRVMEHAVCIEVKRLSTDTR